MNGMSKKEESYFDGGLLEYLLRYLIGVVGMVVSLGLLYPWIMCYMYGWKVNHTVINGR